jgi:hypothetical protein
MTQDQNQALTSASPQGIVPFSYDQFAGPTGFEGADHERDRTTPFLAILQTNSKALVEGHQKFVKGAKAGSFLNTGTNEVIDGKVGFGLVPLKIDHHVVEWEGQAGSGRFVARHAIDAPIFREAVARYEADPNPKKKFSKDVKTTDGRTLVETYYLWALILGADGETPVGGAIIPFKSTNIAVYRKQVYTPLFGFKGTGGRLFVHRLRCSLAQETRPDGISFNYRFEPLKGSITESLIDPKSPLMSAAYESLGQITKGEIKMAEPVADAEASDAETRDEAFA